MMALFQLNRLASPLDEQQLVTLKTALTDLSSSQMAWVSGYLAGLGAAGAPAPVPTRDSATGLTILYGSQTGNARSVAEQLGGQALAMGLGARVVSATDFRPRGLSKERVLLLVVSTQGEGEPPESALELHAFLNGKRAPRLEQLRYAVLGLGDSSYEFFCQAAVAFDERLAELGARRLESLRCCDLVYETDANAWSSNALEAVSELTRERGAEVVAFPGVRLGAATRSRKDHPYIATLLENRRITTNDSASDVHHLALAIDPRALSYEPGDSLGVWFRNDPGLVDEILAACALDGDSSVVLNGKALALRRALSERLELTQLHPTVAAGWGQLVGSEALQDLSKDACALRTYSAERQFIDLLAEHPGRVDAASVAGLLRPLQPRLYSIASSQAEYEDEVHLTVCALHYPARGRVHKGAASGYLCERLGEEEPLQVYVVENPVFRLPDDGDVPVIMVGAGTGVAPFRAFLQQRGANGDAGRNWLIFGNRHFQRDFLYQLEWQAQRKAGLLDKVSLAFSRDTQDKRYVQHRLKEQGAEIYRWLQEGAHFYLCGSTGMGREVQEALVDLVAREACLSEEAARDSIENLRREGRYQRDLY